MASLEIEKENFKSLLLNNEEWLMDKILAYAEEYDYTKYTSTLKEAWRVSIEGLTTSFIKLLDVSSDIPELSPDDDYSKDPASQFGMIEAQKHRSRGVNFSMFLSLFKYYRQSYHDLLKTEEKLFDDIEFFRQYTDRFFDRLEISYCTEWAGLKSEKQILELSQMNLGMTNEKNKYLTIYDSFASPVVILDKDGKVENFNLKALEVFQGKTVPGAHYYKEHKISEEFYWLSNEINDILNSDSVDINFEKLYEPKGLTFDVRLSKLHDVSKKFVGYTVLMTDITSIKKAQSDLALANKKQLEQEKILIQQVKLAAMGEMIGSIAHQWRQPLNALNVNIENLEFDFEEGLIDKEFIDKFISSQTKTLHYMSQTIDDFRNFFKIDKKKTIFSVKEAIKNSISIQEVQLKNSDISIDILGEDFEVDGYESEFQQVIMNLISNSKDVLKEKQKSDAKITISLKDKSVIFEDNGAGISDEILQRIFEPYFTTKEQGSGMGMGLYVSKMIIEDNMGGAITAKNTTDGVAFTIELS